MKIHLSFMKMYIYFKSDNSLLQPIITEIVWENRKWSSGKPRCLHWVFLGAGQTDACKTTENPIQNELTILEIPHDFFFLDFCSWLELVHTG